MLGSALAATALASWGSLAPVWPAAPEPTLAQPQVAAATASASASASAPAAAARPHVVSRFIPLPATRRRQMQAYARRHYGISSARLRPRVIVQHFSVTSSAQQVYNIFAVNRADPELRELPGVCAHFAISRDGTIWQLAPLNFMCRHTVGLNHVALGIEHVGFSDAQVLSNPRQMRASLRLTHWLRCRYQIPVQDVIGHNENREHRLHRERVARLRRQTHYDFKPASMRVYRSRLNAQGGC